MTAPTTPAKSFQHLEPLPIWMLLFVGVPLFLIAAAFAAWLLVWLVLGLQVIGQMPLAIAGFGVAVLVVVYRVFAFGQRLFGRRGVIVDQERETVTVLGGLFVPSVVTTVPLPNFQRLRIRRRNGQKVDGLLHQLEMVGANENPLCLMDEMTYVAARDLGERIGIYLNWDLEDAAPTIPVLLPFTMLGKSLAEQRTESLTAMLDPPPDLVGQVEMTGERVVYKIPSRGGWGCSLSFVVATAIVVGGFLSMYIPSKEIDKIQVIAMSVLPFIFWCIGLVTLLQETERTAVEIDPRGVCIRRKRFFWTNSQYFPAASIREIRQELKTNLRLIATIGEARLQHADWKDVEVDWLRDAITHTLQSPFSK